MSEQASHYPTALELMAVARLRPCRGNARTHSKKQIRQIADSIQKFGFTNPILIGDDDEIVAGHGRLEAAKLLGMQSVPTLRLSHLDAAQRRAYLIADNKLALNGGWDHKLLTTELQALIDLEFDVGVTGFSSAEVDQLFDEARASSPDPERPADDYKVGYGKPPMHSRFRKGQSGNPGGRPRGMSAGRATALALKEAYRRVNVREGDKVITLPAIQAVLRSQVALAAKGNGPAQRTVIEATQAIEREIEARLAPKGPALDERASMSDVEIARRIAFILAKPLAAQG